MLALISLNECDQNLHLIGLWGPVRRLKNQLQSLKGSFQVIVISDGLNIH
jgi:hypothetical protein